MWFLLWFVHLFLAQNVRTKVLTAQKNILLECLQWAWSKIRNYHWPPHYLFRENNVEVIYAILKAKFFQTSSIKYFCFCLIKMLSLHSFFINVLKKTKFTFKIIISLKGSHSDPRNNTVGPHIRSTDRRQASVWRIFIFVFIFANTSQNIRICICIHPFLSTWIYLYLNLPFFSNQIYFSLSYPFFVNPNIFVFLYVKKNIKSAHN